MLTSDLARQSRSPSQDIEIKTAVLALINALVCAAPGVYPPPPPLTWVLLSTLHFAIIPSSELFVTVCDRLGRQNVAFRLHIRLEFLMLGILDIIENLK